MKTMGYKKAKETGLKVLGTLSIFERDGSLVATVVVGTLTPLKNIINPRQYADLRELIATT